MIRGSWIKSHLRCTRLYILTTIMCVLVCVHVLWSVCMCACMCIILVCTFVPRLLSALIFNVARKKSWEEPGDKATWCVVACKYRVYMWDLDGTECLWVAQMPKTWDHLIFMLIRQMMDMYHLCTACGVIICHEHQQYTCTWMESTKMKMLRVGVHLLFTADVILDADKKWSA